MCLNFNYLGVNENISQLFSGQHRYVPSAIKELTNKMVNLERTNKQNQCLGQLNI